MWTSQKKWNKIFAEDERERKAIEKARKRFEKLQDKHDAKELRRYERVLEKGMRISGKDWL